MENNDNLIYGRNSVLELLKSSRSIDKLFVQVGDKEGSINTILKFARDKHIPIQDISRQKLDALCMFEGRPANHQGVAAQIPPKDYWDIDDLISHAKSCDIPLLLVLDGLTDPQNVGAIIRSAECFGAQGVIIPKHRACSITPQVVKASSGAAEYLPAAKVTNIPSCIEQLKREGFWIIGADTDGGDLSRSNLDGPMALVIGAEGTGISRLVKERCDSLVSIKTVGKVESLNASVAAGIVLYEKTRQNAVTAVSKGV